MDAAASRRRISVSVDELLATPWVLAVAGSVEKAAAIAAVGPFRDSSPRWSPTTARPLALLRLPAVESHVLDRTGRAALGRRDARPDPAARTRTCTPTVCGRRCRVPSGRTPLTRPGWSGVLALLT